IGGHREGEIEEVERVGVGAGVEVTGHGITIITGGLLLALVLCLGWIGGLNLDFFTAKSGSLPDKKVDADPPDPAKSNRLAVQGSPASTIAATTGRAHEASERGRQTESLLTKQGANASQPTVVERNAKPAPVPETRPTT